MIFLTDANTYISELSSLNLQEVDRPVLSYDNLKKQLIYSFIGRTIEKKEYIIEIRIKISDLYRVEKIYVYEPQETVIAPDIFAPLIITAIAGEEFNTPVISNNTEAGTVNTERDTLNCEEICVNMQDILKNAKEKGCF